MHLPCSWFPAPSVARYFLLHVNMSLSFRSLRVCRHERYTFDAPSHAFSFFTCLKPRDCMKRGTSANFLPLPQRYRRGLRSSGVWCRVTGRLMHDVSRHRSSVKGRNVREDASFLNSGFEDTVISNLLRDFRFSRN